MNIKDEIYWASEEVKRLNICLGHCGQHMVAEFLNQYEQAKEKLAVLKQKLRSQDGHK